MRPKHPKDGNHGKRGMVAGNGRYSRARLNAMLDGKMRRGGSRKDRTMGKN